VFLGFSRYFFSFYFRFFKGKRVFFCGKIECFFDDFFKELIEIGREKKMCQYCESMFFIVYPGTVNDSHCHLGHCHTCHTATLPHCHRAHTQPHKQPLSPTSHCHCQTATATLPLTSSHTWPSIYVPKLWQYVYRLSKHQTTPFTLPQPLPHAHKQPLSQLPQPLSSCHCHPATGL
jgi:hypothetical protein